MPINEVIRKKRKNLGFTQEQIANSLGVSVPAVSKWENGSSYPDVTIIPALARLLKTDLNTLLCYEQELSEKEVGDFLNKVSEIIINEGFDIAFQIAQDKIKEYPNDVRLIYSVAMVLQGSMLMEKLSIEESKYYDSEIQYLYELVGSSDNLQYANQANYMLASRAINDDEYKKAQELLDRLPEYNGLDKRMLQAKLWMKEEKIEDAAKSYEHKILSAVNEIQAPLLQLIRIAVQEQEKEHALELVKCGEGIIELFGFWRYNSYIYLLEKATAEKNVEEALSVLKPMMEALLIPWNMKDSPITRHIQEKIQNYNMGQKMLSSIITDLENNPAYHFLRDQKEFIKLLEQYKERQC